MDKNLEHVQNIVKDMADFASGSYFIYDGDLFPIDRDEFCKLDGCTIQQENVCGDIHTFYIMSDGTMIFEGDLEIATVGDFFSDFFDSCCSKLFNFKSVSKLRQTATDVRFAICVSAIKLFMIF